MISIIYNILYIYCMCLNTYRYCGTSSSVASNQTTYEYYVLAPSLDYGYIACVLRAHVRCTTCICVRV